MMFRFFLLSAFLFSLNPSSSGQIQNYREIFGKKYEQAEEFIIQNLNSFKKYFPDTSEFRLATSIVFPEIIRFNEMYDKIEVEALKTLYVQYGDHYANFSIGPFQMKPTFAEQLEKEYCKMMLENDLDAVCLFDTNPSWKARIKRVERLSALEGQLMYLSLFCEISENRFRNLKFDTPTDRVKFLASAYNSGYHNPVENISLKKKEKHFHTKVIYNPKTEKYCYSDISAFYFSELKIR